MELADAFRRVPYCSRGKLVRVYGLGGAATAGACCGRQLAAMADLTVALWGARWWPGWLCDEGGVEARWLCVGRDQNGRGEVAAGRGDSGARTCKTRALAVPRTRMPGVRQNANTF